MICNPSKMKILLTALLSSSQLMSAVSQSAYSYCSFSPSHIMCKNSGRVSYNCGEYYYRGLTKEEKLDALHHHNRLRSRLAVGSTIHPAAANMMELQWDEELAILAQTHADQCLFVHDCSDCRRVSRFRVGQNLLRDKSTIYDKPDWRFATDSWFREIKDFPNIDNTATYRFIPGTGHFAQMMWADTKLVGCGLIIYKNRETEPKIARYYVCHYGPVGNYIGQRIYQPGQPCSSCPRYSSCSASYTGLCSGNQAASGNYTSLVNNQRPRIDTSTRRVPRVRDTPNLAGINTVNTRRNTNVRNEDQVQISSQNINVGQTRNIGSSRIQSSSYKRPRTYSRSQYNPCTNILCQIANLFN